MPGLLSKTKSRLSSVVIVTSNKDVQISINLGMSKGIRINLRYVIPYACPIFNNDFIKPPVIWTWMSNFMHNHVLIIDLRTAQVYWYAIFLVSQEVYLNFHHFCG